MQIQMTGIGWYRAADYDQLRALFVDGHRLPTTHSEWLRAAEKVEANIRASGVRVVRVEIRPDEFESWCRRKGFRMDASARMEYSNEGARREHQRASGASST